jgi:hypothetical protein
VLARPLALRLTWGVASAALIVISGCETTAREPSPATPSVDARGSNPQPSPELSPEPARDHNVEARESAREQLPHVEAVASSVAPDAAAPSPNTGSVDKDGDSKEDPCKRKSRSGARASRCLENERTVFSDDF